MSGQSNGQTPPQSSPQSQSSVQSSSSASTQSVADSKEDSDTTNAHNTPSDRDQYSKVDGPSPHDRSSKEGFGEGHGIQGEPEHRKQRARKSGGFLLQPPSGPISQSNPLEFSTQSISENSKGKRKVEQGDLAISKRRTVRQYHQARPALGNSPLSVEVFNATPTPAEGNDTGWNREEILSDPSRSSNVNHSSKDQTATTEPRPITDRYEPPLGARSALGHDTDPAQIVNLALNLSESRRRAFSGGRSPPINGLGNRRLPSLNQHAVGPSAGIATATGGGSLSQYLQKQRQTSRNVSPRSSRRRDRDFSFPPSPRKPDSQKQPFFIDHTDELFPSDATVARAERARVTLELCYEYRRLLDYLPPILPPSKNKPTSARPTTKTRMETAPSLGRSYNPLQYIRNRAVRDRQGRKIDAEAAGWKDLNCVKSWIDIVASERDLGMRTIDDPYPLPPFESTGLDPNSTDRSPEVETANATGGLTNKPRRSKFTRSIAPWDLLADAYWLHQDDNMKDIEDRNGNKIFQAKDTNQESVPRTSPESARSSIRRSQSVTRQFGSPEKPSSLISSTFVPSSRNGSRERGRRQHHQHHHREHDSPISNENSSRDRRRRWPRGLIRSRSSSSSNESFEGRIVDYPDSAALEKQMRELAKKEAESEMLANIEKPRQNSDPLVNSQPDHINQKAANGTSIHSDIRRTEALQELRHVRSNSDQISYSPRTSFDEKRRPQRRHSLEAPATDAENSSNRDLEPNNSIRPSPPVSRPATPKQFLPSGSSPLRRSHEVQDIDTENEMTDPVRRTTGDSKSHDLPYKDRIANFGSGLLSPITAEALGRKFKRADGVSARSSKEANDPESKFRGFFRGGRIAEIVGSEVNRVGDRMWKKESSGDLSRAPPTLFNDPSEESDVETDMSGMDSSPEDRLSRTTTNNDESVRPSQNSTAVDRPKYHMSHLPSFRSPFSKDEQSSDILKGHLHADHITRQQMAQRAQGRPSRFELYAPPKIDIERISPTPSPPMSRTRTRDTDTSYDGSRRSSVSRSDSRAREADRRLNVILGSPGTAGAGGPPVTLLSALDSGQHRSSKGVSAQGERRWSISDRGVSAVRGTVTKRDIARVRALLLSSGIKANEITRRAQEIPTVPSAQLQKVQDSLERPLPRVPRSQEHILIARMLISNIDASNRQLREAAEAFTQTTMKKLYDQIQRIEEHVADKLTPAVGAATDEADAFSIELTTTHTLAVKQLHDSVDIILRKRRRRFRWVRRGGYVMLEWTLLGIMWWAWLIVVIIRLIRGTVGGAVGVVKWLFWI